MGMAAILIAMVGSVLNHYAFSFQRFTLAIARQYTASAREIGALQLLMTPVGVGTLAWLARLLRWGAAVLLGLSFSWWIAIGYLVADFVLFGAMMPLFPLRSHFASMALKQLRRGMYEADSELLAKLMVDVLKLRDASSVRNTV